MNQYQKMKAQLLIYSDAFTRISKIISDFSCDTDADTLRRICLDVMIRLEELERNK